MLRTFYLRASEADDRFPGSDVVLNGLQDYIREYKMKAANPSDLWQILREASGTKSEASKLQTYFQLKIKV